jgi:hypothetical protein
MAVNGAKTRAVSVCFRGMLKGYFAVFRVYTREKAVFKAIP